ncbi:hypothetical protein KAH37_00775 [bacterium]|nr:hypothetical protein [bacterium]
MVKNFFLVNSIFSSDADSVTSNSVPTHEANQLGSHTDTTADSESS